MPKCLGIYIEDDVIKYAKIDKNKDVLKIDSFNVVFYDSENLSQTIEKIIRETYSTKDFISINVSNELYNYFEVFSGLKLSDKKKSIDLDFELLCGEKKYDKVSLETRTFFISDKDNHEKERVIHVASNKENIRKRVQAFPGLKISTITPITTSIFNLIQLGIKENNVLIVNIEKNTKVTTIIDGEIYNIDIIPEGMGEILNSINNIENSMQKSYECCKNTTIYTQDTQSLQLGENEHLDDIMPILYKIVNNVKMIADSVENLNKIYVTGLGTAINNVDLYFQENIPNIKCELLKPFFLEKNASMQIPIKDYIEVNSATALALEGLGFGKPEFNFKNKSALEMEITPAVIKNFFAELFDPHKELTAIDKTLLRVVACFCIGIIGYSVLSNSIVTQIDEKEKNIATLSQEVDEQIDVINGQISKVKNGQATYEQLVSALTAIEDTSGDSSYNQETYTNTTIIEKDSIPNLLNRIVQLIPTQVTITSIKNTENRHIVIEAQASKYEQLGFFRALLSTEEALLNVKSTSGSKSGETITITIEGDLP